MNKNKILIYGASGYMGQLFLKTIQHQNFDVILGSRQALKANYPVRVFALDTKTEILAQIKDVQLVINLAGPFKNTNRQLVEACLENGTHYMDIAGEYSELESVFSYDELAKRAHVMLMPGAGFGVVPTDIVANLAHQKLPDATLLKIAYITHGGASRGTLKTVLADIHKAGVILKNGNYEKAMPASKIFQLSANNKRQTLVYNPWRADLFSASISTGIPNIETYSNFPGFVVKMMQGKMLWLRDFMLKRLMNVLPIGPSEKQIQKGSTLCYAEVSNAKGETASATIMGPEAYWFTAETLLAITKHILNGNYQTGFQTPNMYGADLIQSIPHVKIS